MNKAKKTWKWLSSAILMTIAIPTAAIAATVSWQWANPLPQGSHLRSIAQSTGANPIKVAVGDKGAIVVNAGKGWQRANSGVQDYILDVDWTGIRFVAVGSLGSILTSINGQTWSQTNPFRKVYYSSVAHGTGAARKTLVVVGQDVVRGTSFIAYSTNGGGQWQAATVPTGSGPLNQIIWNGAEFIAVGRSNTVLTSADGITWVKQTPFTPAATNQLAVTWNGTSVLIAGRSGRTTTIVKGTKSPKGVWTWTRQAIKTSPANAVLGYPKTLKYDPVNAVYWLLNGVNIFTSTAGATWTKKNNTIVRLLDVWFETAQITGVGYDGEIATSTDIGATWASQLAGVKIRFSSLAQGKPRGNNLIVAVGSNGVLTSPDGIKWTQQTTNANFSLEHVSWNGTRFVAVSRQGGALTSTDGVTWTRWGNAPAMNATAWGGGPNGRQYVGVGPTGKLYTSGTGSPWTPQTSPVDPATNQPLTNEMTDVVWDGTNNTYIAVGRGGAIWTSPDGLNWTSRTSNTNRDLFAVDAYAQTIVAVGLRGSVVSTDGGATWKQGTPISFLEDVRWNPDMSAFVAVGIYGRVYTSVDGLIWNQLNTPASATLQAVSSDGLGGLVVTGSTTILHGTITTTGGGTGGGTASTSGGGGGGGCLTTTEINLWGFLPLLLMLSGLAALRRQA